MKRFDATVTSWIRFVRLFTLVETKTGAAPIRCSPKRLRTIVQGPPPRIWIMSLWLHEVPHAPGTARSKVLSAISVGPPAWPRMKSQSRQSWKLLCRICSPFAPGPMQRLPVPQSVISLFEIVTFESLGSVWIHAPAVSVRPSISIPSSVMLLEPAIWTTTRSLDGGVTVTPDTTRLLEPDSFSPASRALRLPAILTGAAYFRPDTDRAG